MGVRTTQVNAVDVGVDSNHDYDDDDVEYLMCPYNLDGALARTCDL
jgi:hypothetical protein